MAELSDPGAPWRSALYEGRVRHRRYGDVPHGFERALYLFYLDLAELPDVLAGNALWSATRPAPVRFRRRDYFGAPEQPLADSVRNACN